MPSSPAADRWQFEKVGLGYRCWSEEIQTEFRLTHIKRSHGDLTGELKVSTNMKGVKTKDGVLHVARLNVLSSSSRVALARILEKRTPGFDMDWFDGLEWLCQSVILAEQEGEPILELGSQTAPDERAKFLVEPLMLKGMPSLLFGPGGVGKSLIALACGMSVAAGREIIPGIPPAAQGNVLYLDWETDANTILTRMQSIGHGHGFTPPYKSLFYRFCRSPLADDVEELAAIVDQKKIVAVIVDSAAHAMGVAGEYGDANESTIRMHQALRLMDVGSLTVDHISKSDGRTKPGSASAYGSAYKMNATRNAWEARIARNGGIGLYHAKSNVTALRDPIGVYLTWEAGQIEFKSSGPIRDEPPADTSMTGMDLIRDHMSDGARRTSDVVARELDLNASSTRVWMRRLFNAGELLSEGGLYWVDTPVDIRTRRPVDG